MSMYYILNQERQRMNLFNYLLIIKNTSITGMNIGKYIGAKIDKTCNITETPCGHDIAESFGTITGFSIGLMLSPLVITIEALDDLQSQFTGFDITDNVYNMIAGETQEL
jgi:hypothetical protein